MSAFGRRNGPGSGAPSRPAFGVARPMQGGGPARPSDVDGGDQFPPLPGALSGGSESPLDQSTVPGAAVDALQRLAERQASSGEDGQSKMEGFESSIHRIKEQVLPRLLERVDPEAAATLNKDELAEEFRPIIGEVLAELKLTLNRREQFALEKVLVDELLGQHQVVVKNLEANYRKVPDVSAATILGDGRVALILDVSGLVRRSRH